MNMKMMSLPLLCLGLIGLGGCSLNAIHGSGAAKTEARAVGSFSKIDLTGAPDVEVMVGPAVSVAVTADDNLLPFIETTVDGETLKIGSKQSYSTSIGVKVKITVPALHGVLVTGSGDIHAAGLKAGQLEVNVTGSGDVTLSGVVDQLRARIIGSGDLRAGDLTAKNVSVGVTGSGDASVRATEQLEANVTGSGNVRYAGNPTHVARNVTGPGEIGPL
jgi:hypothetical protein